MTAHDPEFDLRVRRAALEDIAQLADLFDQYRVFYRRRSDRDGAQAFLRARLENGESVIFLATSGSAAAGFTQLYPSFSSVAMAPVWILNDLFVAPAYRRRGVARSLLDAAAQHAEATGAIHIELETQEDNHAAQQLYAAQGYARSVGFWRYVLPLAGNRNAGRAET